MTTRGLNIIKSKYEKIIKLRHSRKQLKNRVNHLNPMWHFGDKLMKNTGLDRKVDGTIDATPEWWKNELKVLLHYLTFVKVGICEFIVTKSVHYRDGLQSARSFNGAGLLISPIWSKCSKG